MRSRWPTRRRAARHPCERFLDGAELPKVTAHGSLAAGAAGADVMGIGNEVHTGARGRGITGSVTKARLSVLTGEFNPQDDVKYQRAKASGTALLMSFQAPVTGGAYTPELGETVVRPGDHGRPDTA